MIQYEVQAHYGTQPITIKTDSLAEMHEALAGIAELNRDARYLKHKGVENIVPVYRMDGDENDYYGWGDAKDTRHGVTFGRKRKESAVPFFPKGKDGYYDPKKKGGKRPPQREASAEGERPKNGGGKRRQQPERREQPQRPERQRAPARPNYEDAYPDDDLPF